MKKEQLKRMAGWKEGRTGKEKGETEKKREGGGGRESIMRRMRQSR